MNEVAKDPNAWLDEQHEWYEQMDRLERWQRWRAILDGMDTKEMKEKFLPRTAVELDADYEFRIQIAEFIGITEASIERITGAVFGTPAKIDVKKEAVKAFADSCDGSDTTLVDFFETVSSEAQCMGIAFVGIDRAKLNPDVRPANMAQEIASGSLRCYATLYTAEDVRNWSFDDKGELDSVIIGRLISVQPTIISSTQYFDERRVITKTETTTWRKALDEKGMPKKDAHWTREGDVIAHNLGMVPIVPVYGVYVDPMKGDSVHKNAVKADIARFSEETWAAIDRYRHAHPLLVLNSSRELKDMQLGHVFRTLEDEKLDYVSPSGVTFEASEKAIARLKQDAITQSGSNPAATSDSPNSTRGESGIAQRVRFTHTEERTIKKHARSIEKAMKRVLLIAEQWLTGAIDKTNPPSVAFYTSFDTMDPSERANAYLKLQYVIHAASWHRHQLKKLAIETSPDAEESERQEMQKEIDEQPIESFPDPSLSSIGA